MSDLSYGHKLDNSDIAMFFFIELSLNQSCPSDTSNRIWKTQKNLNLLNFQLSGLPSMLNNIMKIKADLPGHVVTL